MSCLRPSGPYGLGRQLYLPWKWSLSGPSALGWMCRETKAEPFYYRSSIEDKARRYNPKGGVYSHFRSCYMIMLLQEKTRMWVWWHAIKHVFIQLNGHIIQIEEVILTFSFSFLSFLSIDFSQSLFFLSFWISEFINANLVSSFYCYPIQIPHVQWATIQS